MSVLVVGVSHKTAPVSVLERLALDADGVAKLVREVIDSDHVLEATALATCNRIEVYADVDRFHGSVETVSRLLCERAGEKPEDVVPHLYVHYDDGAVSHLFGVAAGLESMVVGEGQISARPATRCAWGRSTAPSAPRSTCCSSRPCGSASAPTPRPTSTAPRRRWSASPSSAPPSTSGRWPASTWS